ncbi:killer cell lectin-like receptor subfamily G member 1 isoform X1 [Echinops telfairi]|uniref:Killer cell lectin-like receptor subfamily G member 1 isoform X1 n=3 Tax=Echinops telfairi TaxID=9371 RepID=A0ABM0J8Y5_ECHTE|nr:killer cell lectin-like receptor subfamily G member 1 isoform X1 [Echinops telfairi]
MEQTDSSIYSFLESPAAPQVQNDFGEQRRAPSPRSSLSYVAIALGLLTAILMSVLLYQWILCWDSNDSPCASCPSCPDRWMKYGDHCYYFSGEKKDWNSSLEFCFAKDSHLLMLQDSHEMSLFKTFLSNDFHWVGLRRKSDWRWEDGSVLNFSSVVSNSLVQMCGAMNKDGLQASSCEALLQWICKKTRF